MNRQDDLAERLRAAVPETPDLHDLAGNAEAQGRRRRNLARSAGAAAVVVVVVGAVLIPALFRPGSEPPQPTPASDLPQCVDQSDVDSRALRSETVRWVRFCGRDDGQTGIARFPEGALTGEMAAAVVDGWAQPETCDDDAGPFLGRGFWIQIGYADGQVAQLESSTSCSGGELVYRNLLSALSLDLASPYEPGGPPLPTTCPDRLRTDQTNTDGASAELLTGDDPIAQLSTRPILALPASEALVCRYTGYRSSLQLDHSWVVRSPAAEEMRVVSLTGYTDGMADCGVDETRPSYVVALRDKTGTARTFAIDGPECGPLSAAIGTPAEEQYLGLSSQVLVDTIEGSRTG